jgi:multidrug efflux pump
MMGGRRVTTFVDNGEEYDVMLQADRAGRTSVADLDALQARAKDGSLVPLSNLVSLREVAEPGTYNRFNRLRSITLSARLSPDYPLGEAVSWAQQTADSSLPDYAQVSWKGESRELQQSGGEVLITFALALLIVYLVLAAQFESFVHPLVIMLTVPLGVLGVVLATLFRGYANDVYFQVGVIGVLLFAALIGVALVRAWLLATGRRSVVYLWPALMLVTIAVTSFAESFAITEGGWMLLVVCAVKSARDMSWRDALAANRPPGPAVEPRF